MGAWQSEGLLGTSTGGPFAAECPRNVLVPRFHWKPRPKAPLPIRRVVATGPYPHHPEPKKAKAANLSTQVRPPLCFYFLPTNLCFRAVYLLNLRPVKSRTYSP